MSHEPEDDALSWDGDDDATLVTGGRAARTPTAADAVRPSNQETELPTGWSSVGSPGRVEAHETRDRPQTGSTALIVLGVLGGIYLLYTIGWIITATRLHASTTDAVSAFMATLGSWLAVLAPPAWFGLVFWLTRTGSRRRIIWLVVGAIVLAPLPFVVGYAS